LPQPVARPFYAQAGDGLIGVVLGTVLIIVLRKRTRRTATH
jgi:hypothetical protein